MADIFEQFDKNLYRVGTVIDAGDASNSLAGSSNNSLNPNYQDPDVGNAGTQSTHNGIDGNDLNLFDSSLGGMDPIGGDIASINFIRSTNNSQRFTLQKRASINSNFDNVLELFATAPLTNRKNYIFLGRNGDATNPVANVGNISLNVNTKTSESASVGNGAIEFNLSRDGELNTSPEFFLGDSRLVFGGSGTSAYISSRGLAGNTNVAGIGSLGTATITNIALTTNVLTVTANNSFYLIAGFGESVTLSGLTTSTFLNGQTVQILSRSDTQFTAAFTHADVASHADTGLATATAIALGLYQGNDNKVTLGLDFIPDTDNVYDIGSSSFRIKNLYLAGTVTGATNLANTALSNLSSVAINTSLLPSTDDGAALGSTTKNFSDLFLASGAVVNFNNSNATLTHSTSLLTSNVDIVVPAEAYSSSWNGSNEVPTKNDLYDKIETLGTSFPAQDVTIVSTSPTIGNAWALTSNTTGTVMFMAENNTSGTVNIYRVLKDTVTGNYYVTHTVALTILSTNFGGMGVAGSYLYVAYSAAGPTISLKRYDLADLANATSMTISGTGRNSFMFGDGTNLYIYNGSNGSFDKFTISGTTATNAATVTYTSAGTNLSAISDGTSAWITSSTGTSITTNKYPIAGGASTATNTALIHADAYYQGNNHSGTSVKLFMASSTALGIGWDFTWTTPTVAVGYMLHLMAIGLP